MAGQTRERLWTLRDEHARKGLARGENFGSCAGLHRHLQVGTEDFLAVVVLGLRIVALGGFGFGVALARRPLRCFVGRADEGTGWSQPDAKHHCAQSEP